jgi:quinol monooxygenase YgiN
MNNVGRPGECSRPPGVRSLYDTGPVKDGFPQALWKRILDLREVPGVTDVELTVVAGTFVARSGKEAELAAVLARYVVLSRSVTGCRNVDLMASTTETGRFLMVEKWDDEQAQKDHLNGEIMVTMATEATNLLAGPPDLGLYDAVSVYDLE